MVILKEDSATIDFFPMPPSVNKMFASVRGRMIKSKDGRLFDLAVAEYLSIHKTDCLKASQLIQGWIKQGKFLDVRCAFSFKADRLFWKRKGTLRPLDTNNRIKPTLDGLSRIIQTDDTYFITNHMTKCVSFQEMVTIKIQACDMLTSRQFLDL